MNIRLSFLILSVLFSHALLGQNLEWIFPMRGNGFNKFSDLKISHKNYLYTSITFHDTIFLHDDLSEEIISNGDKDILFQKYDLNGNLIWNASIGSPFLDQTSQITTDSIGNLYAVGYHRIGMDFDPGPNTHNEPHGGSVDAYIVKITPHGNLEWVRTFRSGGNDQTWSVFVENNGNVVVGGSVASAFDVDPGLDETLVTGAFIVKYNNQGDFIWAFDFPIGGTQIVTFGKEISSNLTLISGVFSDSVIVPINGDTITYYSYGNTDFYIGGIDSTGRFQWFKTIGGVDQERVPKVSVDNFNNILALFEYKDSIYFSDTASNLLSVSNGSFDILISKWLPNGDTLWTKNIGGAGSEYIHDFNFAADNSLFISGKFQQTVDFDPGSSSSFFTAGNTPYSHFLQWLDENGNFINVNVNSKEIYSALEIDENMNIYGGNYYDQGDDVDFGSGMVFPFTIGLYDIVLHKHNNRGISGYVFNDHNSNCNIDSLENGINNAILVVNPIGHVVNSNAYGSWNIDSLPPGNYTISIDSSGNWQPSCSASQTFTVVHPDSITIVPPIGLINTLPCTEPDVSINIPFIRRCFSDQKVHVHACNKHTATGTLDNAYVIVELDTFLTPTSANMPYTNLGNNQLQFDLGTLYPGQCVDFWINTDVSCDAIPGQSLCMEANLYPADSCVFDTIPTPYSSGEVSPCLSAWDKSSLEVEGYCQNDSIFFVVTNTGLPIGGDMDCFAPVRLFIDGQFILLDSIQLTGGDSIVFSYSGDGRTWRLEADQHPLHPGNSHPNATVELCGNATNWRTGFVNVLPMDDADPIVDIYCGVVTGSFDPNDKTGFPLGVTTEKYIRPNQQLEYQIRFQNTGTDTAFTVVIRDTLDENLNIFSVQSGAASHPYYFRMYGPRVLEWTFNNIMLPDSTTDEPGSHGFTTFKVNQQPNLPHGTQIRNDADIYFDFNAPVITNNTLHTINDSLYFAPSTLNALVTDTICDEYLYNGLSYTQSGTYWQYINNPNGDSLVNIDVNIKESSEYNFSLSECYTYTLNGQTYDSSNTYSQLLVNHIGCDSIINVDLTINQSTNQNISESSCYNYISPSGKSFTTSGIYIDTIPNTNSCDSIITIDLTILNSTSSNQIETACNQYVSPGGNIYSSTGVYSDTIMNTDGCDSIITTDLTLLNTFNSMTESSCYHYTSPSGLTYSTSGNYTDTIPNTNGCDSVITINLTINTVDTSITQTGIVLTANNTGATYQWINCDSNVTILGANNQSYTPIENGSYAVRLSENGCIDTSSCYLINSVGLLESNFDNDIIVYPNPTNGNLQIDLGETFALVSVDILDLKGKTIFSNQLINQNILHLNLASLANGIYLAHIEAGDKKAILRIVKEE